MRMRIMVIKFIKNSFHTILIVRLDEMKSKFGDVAYASDTSYSRDTHKVLYN